MSVAASPFILRKLIGTNTKHVAHLSFGHIAFLIKCKRLSTGVQTLKELALLMMKGVKNEKQV